MEDSERKKVRIQDCAFIIEYIAVDRRAIREPADRAGEHQCAGAEYRHAGDDR